jgi:hypothetical protein
MKTLVFCTAYAADEATWDWRYGRWLEAIRQSALDRQQILIVDDGSPCLPSWPGLRVINEGDFIDDPALDNDEVILYHFLDNLGRSGLRNYPGWFRSFAFGSQYATQRNFDKIVHIESDAFLITQRIQHEFNAIDSGWVTVLNLQYNYPESSIQVIAGKQVAAYHEFTSRGYGEFVGKDIEGLIPFTAILRQFKGARYGEYLDCVPSDADWTVQLFLPRRLDPDYYWWIYRRDERLRVMPVATSVMNPAEWLRSDITVRRFIASFGHYLIRRETLFILLVDEELANICRGHRTAIVQTPSRHQPVINDDNDSFCIHPAGDPALARRVAIAGNPAFRVAISIIQIIRGADFLRWFAFAEQRSNQRSVIIGLIPFAAKDNTGVLRKRLHQLLSVFVRYRPDLKIEQIVCADATLILFSNLNPDSKVVDASEVYSGVMIDDDNLSDLPDVKFPAYQAEALVANKPELTRLLGL